MSIWEASSAAVSHIHVRTGLQPLLKEASKTEHHLSFLPPSRRVHIFFFLHFPRRKKKRRMMIRTRGATHQEYCVRSFCAVAKKKNKKQVVVPSTNQPGFDVASIRTEPMMLFVDGCSMMIIRWWKDGSKEGRKEGRMALRTSIYNKRSFTGNSNMPACVKAYVQPG